MSGALREIIASFGTEFDGKALEHGDRLVEGMIGKLKKFGPALLEAFAIKEIGEFAFGLAEQAEQLKLNATAIGISTDALQKWDYAANLSGVSAEAMNTGLTKLERSAVKAGKGGSLAFGDIKVSVDKAGGGFKDADELLGDVSEAIANMKDPTAQVGAAMAAFGRSGAKLLPFLKQGRAGIAALKDEVEKLGGGFSEDFIEKSEDMIQNSKRLDFAMISLKTAAIGPLLPLISDMAVAATKVVVTLGAWTKKSQVTKTALIALGIGGAAALSPLLLSIAPIVAAFLGLEDVVTFLSGGKSITGDALEKLLGKDAVNKILAFVSALSKDVGPMLHDIMAIFTDGKPLDEKFKELDAYIAGVLGPQFRKDFGEMADSVTTVVEIAASLAETLKDIISAMKWIAENTVGFALESAVKTQDAQANSDAKKDAAARAGTPLDWKTQFSGRTLPQRDESASWFDQLKQQFGIGKDAPQQTAATPVPAALSHDAIAEAFYGRNVASAPVPGGHGEAPQVTQTNNTPITQNFYGIEKADDAGRAASKGAQEGVTTGNNLRTKRALVPTG